MQRLLILLFSISFSFFSYSGFSQSFTVCENSEVSFELEDDYWGEPMFEYSADSSSWEEVNTEIIDPFTISATQSGYYRLRMYDAECDTSYYSEVAEVQLLDTPELTIHSTFFSLQVPASFDPLFWILGSEDLSEITFHVNDTEYTSEEDQMVIPNPGVAFDIYASALHNESGCVLYTDTVTYSVITTQGTANGFFDMEGAFNLEDIYILSSIDSISLGNATDFQLEYETLDSLDYLGAYYTSPEEEQLLVGLYPARPGEFTISMTAESTALSYVLMQSSISSLVWTQFDELSTSVQSHPSYSTVIDLIQGQLDGNGFIDFFNDELFDTAGLIAGDVLEGLNGIEGDMLLGGGEEWFHPSVDMVDVNGKGNLSYQHNAVNCYYALRAYEDGPDDVPISQVVVFQGNQDPLTSDFATGIPETIAGLYIIWQKLATADPYWNDIVVRLPLIRSSENQNVPLFKPSDFTELAEAPYTEFLLRMTNGRLPGDETEVIRAGGLNIFYFLSSLILSIPNFVNKLKTVAGELIKFIYDSFKTGFNGLINSGGEWTLEVINDMLLNFLSLIVPPLIAVGVLTGPLAIIIGGMLAGLVVIDIATPILDFHTYSPDFAYLMARAGDHLTNRLTLLENENENFSAVVGALTPIRPEFRLWMQKEAISPFGPQDQDSQQIVLENAEPYPYYTDFSVDVIMPQCFESVTLLANDEDSEDQMFTELGFSIDPINEGQNLLDLKLDWGAQDSCILSLDFTIDGQSAQGMNGLQEDSFKEFNVSVEQPFIDILSGNNQIQAPDEIAELPVEIEVYSETTELSVPGGYPVKIEVIEGDGEFFFPGESSDWETVATTTTNDGEPISFNWKFGEQGEQVLKASIVNPNTQQEITSVLMYGNATDEDSACGDLPVGTVCSPATGWIWMDRNLGATQVATSLTDEEAYGYLYQWGRGTDGHQLRTSSVTTFLSSSDQPGHGEFIDGGSAKDWRSPSNDLLWQGVSGVNNPCPEGFRIPTDIEWYNELFYWSSQDLAGAFASPLKLTAAGARFVFSTVQFTGIGTSGYYWSSTLAPGSNYGAAWSLLITTSSANEESESARHNALSVRCIKD